MNKFISIFKMLPFFLIAILQSNCGVEENKSNNNDTLALADTTPSEPEIAYGFYLDSFEVYRNTFEPNQFLADILLQYHVTYPEITRLVKQTDSIFDIRKIRVGQDYMVLCNKDSIGKAAYFIYEEDAINYLVFHIGDSLYTYEGKKDLEIRKRIAGGIIKSSLWEAMTSNNLSPALVVSLADIFAWTIDFYTVQEGDYFRVIFDEKYVNNKFIGIGDIKAVQFGNSGTDFYGFLYNQDDKLSYFDETGKGLKKAFLKAPVNFSRISSSYSLKRYHPVQKRWKAHLGTDYAAPTGTPIWSVGDGVILQAKFKKYNGNYVKIKHNEHITTQYLHMSKIAKGIKPGVAVKQGQIIGYVGQTGLATGPHVCFRYWKDGKQVDHRKEKFESSEPIKSANRAAFYLFINPVKARLDSIPLVPIQ